MSKIQDNPNIEYVGYVTDSELADLYRRAKVFALPSFQEGVGMVALEAAVNGCEIVLTEVGAPKEYYNGRAVLVNPYDVDSIGMGVIEAMTRKNAQPELRDHILNHYSLPINMKQLETSLLLIRSTKNIK
jgi:glycosyltransferase involved in cell wall biosynthesis